MNGNKPSLKELLHTIKHNWVILLVFLCGLTLAVIPFAAKAVGREYLPTLVGILVVCCGYLFYDFIETVENWMKSAKEERAEIKERLDADLLVLPLSNAIDHCIPKGGKVDILRISAMSSQTILTNFRSKNVHIKKVQMLLPRLEGRSDLANYNNPRVNDAVSMWEKEDWVEEIEVRYVDYPPSHFLILFNSESCLLGLYRILPKAAAELDHQFAKCSSPIVATGSSKSLSHVIEEHLQWFNKVFEAAKKA